MAYTREIYEKAQEIIDKRRIKAENDAEEKMRLFEKMEPEYNKLKIEMILTVQNAVRAIDISPEKAAVFLEKQKKRNLAAQEKIRELLRKNKLPEDYFKVKYFCPLCSDTGFYNSKLCSCRIDILKRLAFEEAGKSSPLKFCSFEDFKLSYYPDEYSKEHKCSARERMNQILSFCKEYAESFDASSPSILMYGETGLGKTHLSLAVAGAVIKKGFSALYNSAQNIFTQLNREHFGKADSNLAYESMVNECDLLVLDDLGAEFSTPFTNAALYNIINTRINSGLPTIISTNLCLKDMEEKYTRRISSRIIGEFAALCFLGADIRQLKNSE